MVRILMLVRLMLFLHFKLIISMKNFSNHISLLGNFKLYTILEISKVIKQIPKLVNQRMNDLSEQSCEALSKEIYMTVN